MFSSNFKLNASWHQFLESYLLESYIVFGTLVVQSWTCAKYINVVNISQSFISWKWRLPKSMKYWPSIFQPCVFLARVSIGFNMPIHLPAVLNGNGQFVFCVVAQSWPCTAMNAINRVTYQASSWGWRRRRRRRRWIGGHLGDVSHSLWAASLAPASSDNSTSHSRPNLRLSRSWLQKILIVRPRPVSCFPLFSSAQASPSQTQDFPTASVATRY